MSYNLFLDDIRVPYLNDNNIMSNAYCYTKYYKYKSEDWIIVTNYDEFITYIINNGLPKLISFDNDLSDMHYITNDESKYTEKTGYDCAKWLCEYCINNKLHLPEYIIHSMNPVGKINIDTYLKNFKKNFEK